MGTKISALPTVATILDDDLIPFTKDSNLTTSAVAFQDFLASFISSDEWTPAVTFATPGDLAVVYSIQLGQYYKIGDLVTIWWSILTSSFTHSTASGVFRITGLPFTAEAGVTYYAGSMSFSGHTQANYTQQTPVILAGTAIIEFQSTAQGQVESSLGSGSVPTGATILTRGSLTYRAV